MSANGYNRESYSGYPGHPGLNIQPSVGSQRANSLANGQPATQLSKNGTNRASNSGMFRINNPMSGGTGGGMGHGTNGSPSFAPMYRGQRPVFGQNSNTYPMTHRYESAKSNADGTWAGHGIVEYNGQKGPKIQQRPVRMATNQKAIFTAKQRPASPKNTTVKINGCGDSQGSLMSMVHPVIDKRDENKEESVQAPSNQLDHRTAWRLHAPGMPFPGKIPSKNGVNGQGGVQGGPRQGKAERKNTNLEPKAWLYAWLGQCSKSNF